MTLTQIGPIPGAEVHVALERWDEDTPVWDTARWDADEWVDAMSIVSEDISCDVLSYNSTVGRDQPTERFRTGTAQVTVQDPTGKYSAWRTSNIGVNALSLPGINGACMSTPDSARFAPAATVTVIAKVAFANWHLDQTFANQWAGTGKNQWLAGITTSGKMMFQRSMNGNDQYPSGYYESTVGHGFVNGSTHWLRYVFEQNVGGVSRVGFYTSEDGATWTQLGAFDTDASVAATFNAATPVIIGGYINGAVQAPDVDIFNLSIVSPAATVIIDPGSVTDLAARTYVEGGATWTLNHASTAFVELPISVPVGASGIRPGIGMRVWVVLPVDSVYPRFLGRVTAIHDVYPDPSTHNVEFTAADYARDLAAFDGTEQAPIGAGELAGARLHRICDNAGYDHPRAFDVGTVTLQATTLAKNALDEAGIVTDTEMGAFWCDAAGVLIFRDANGIVNDPHYTQPQAVFGEVEPELCYTDLELSSDLDKIKNIVSVARVGGTAVVLQDETSQALYGPHTYKRTDLIHESDAHSTVVADRHLEFYAYAANRVDRLTPLVTLTALPELLPLGVLWRIQLRRRAEGFQVVADLQIQGITETVTPSEWTMLFSTFSAEAIFDAAQWDVDLWNAGLWGY